MAETDVAGVVTCWSAIDCRRRRDGRRARNSRVR